MQGSNGDTDIQNRLTDLGGGRKERVGDMERVTWKYRIPYENRYPVGICGVTQETQTGAR